MEEGLRTLRRLSEVIIKRLYWMYNKPTGIPPLKSMSFGVASATEEGDFSTCEDEVNQKPSNGPSNDSDSAIPEEGKKEVEISHTRPIIPTIMVAGRARNGKSTALNNIFDLKLVARTAAKSVTQVVSVTEVTKKIPIPGKDNATELITLQVIDTPGLGALDIHKEDILKEMKKVTIGREYTLLYCYSVAPNTTLTETDKAIILHLNLALGSEIWKKCVLLFTFSDYAKFEFEDDPDEYVEHIKNHAAEFQKLLKDVTGQDLEVKSIFEYSSPEELEKEEKPSGIIAIPVKKTTKKSKQVLLGMVKKDQDWTDIAFIELMKRTDEDHREPFILFKYPMVVLTSSATAAGAAAGAVVGGLVGVLGGPLGVVAGASAGAVVGVAAGGLTALTINKVVRLVHSTKMKQQEAKSLQQ